MWARPLVGLSGHLPSCSAPSSILATGRFVCPTARGGTRGRREASLCHGSGFLLVVTEPPPPLVNSPPHPAIAHARQGRVPVTH